MATNEELIAAARLIAKCYSAGDDPAIVDPAAEAMEQALAKLDDKERLAAFLMKGLFLGRSVILHSDNPMSFERAKEITELLGGTYEAAVEAWPKPGIMFHPPGKAAA